MQSPGVELWPLNDVRISFLYNILSMNEQNLTKFADELILTASSLGLLSVSSLQSYGP